MLKEVVEHRARVRVLTPSSAGFALRTATFGEYGVLRVAIDGIRYRGTAGPPTPLLATVMTRGRGRIRGRSLDLRLTAGDGFLGPIDVDYDAEYDSPAFAVVQLTTAFVASIAEQTLGTRAGDFRFLSHLPASPALAGRWIRTVEFATAQLEGDRPAEPPSLLVAELLRLVAASSLVTFPNTAMTAGHPPGAGRVTPATLRRAVACVDERAGEPITAADIAEHAGIGLRALQEVFRRHLDTTPTAYLRRVRLERAHRELQDADPAGGVTVGMIARRWGFSNPGRFTARYRAAYGRLPSRTLQD